MFILYCYSSHSLYKNIFKKKNYNLFIYCNIITIKIILPNSNCNIRLDYNACMQSSSYTLDYYNFAINVIVDKKLRCFQFNVEFRHFRKQRLSDGNYIHKKLFKVVTRYTNHKNLTRKHFLYIIVEIFYFHNEYIFINIFYLHKETV